MRAWRRNSHHARTPSEFMYVTCAVSNTTRPTIAGNSSSNRVASVKSPRKTTRIRSPSLTTCHWVSLASTARARSSGLSNATPTTVLPSRGCAHTAVPRTRAAGSPSGAIETSSTWPSATGSPTTSRTPSIERFETVASTFLPASSTVIENASVPSRGSPSWIATTSWSSSAVIGAIKSSSQPHAETWRIWSPDSCLPATRITRIDGFCALITRVASNPAGSASITTSAGSSLRTSACASAAFAATSSCRSSRWNGVAVKCRSSAELLETRTLGTGDQVHYHAIRRQIVGQPAIAAKLPRSRRIADDKANDSARLCSPRASGLGEQGANGRCSSTQQGAQEHDQRDGQEDRAADRGDAARQVAAIIGPALGSQLLDLGGPRGDRAAQAVDPLIQLGELRILDPVQVDERAERDQPAGDLAFGLRDLARLALLLGVELGEPVGVALAGVA